MAVEVVQAVAIRTPCCQRIRRLHQDHDQEVIGGLDQAARSAGRPAADLFSSELLDGRRPPPTVGPGGKGRHGKPKGPPPGKGPPHGKPKGPPLPGKGPPPGPAPGQP